MAKLLIFDGYVDEPSILGVPPYISPYVRYIYGAAARAFEDSGLRGEIRYVTINQFRKEIKENRGDKLFPDKDVVVLVNNTPVPGNYLGGRPASFRELENAAELARSQDAVVFSWKNHLRNAINLEKDVDAFIYDLLTGQESGNRFRTDEEWDEWAVRGAGILPLHPDFPDTMMLEVDTLKGCVRYINGGCSFCTDPLEMFRMRTVDSILREVEACVNHGARNLRLGGSCIFSYRANGIGDTDRPIPDPEELTRLFKGIRALLPTGGVFHTDNANAGIIASHPGESGEVLRAMIEYTSPGNSLSLGLESADPEVIRKNHLNAEPHEIREAIRMINSFGRECGENGMPRLLPGINLLYGLPGETEETYRINFEFLKGIREEGLLLRRINIRQLSQVRIKRIRKNPIFRKWKEKVRNEIDVPNLKDILPKGTLLKGVYIELHHGGVSFGRQVGTYPILVGIPFPVDIGEIVDVKINEYGKRSVTGIPVPFDINHVTLKALSALPGVGRKRAARIIRRRPIRSFEQLSECLEDRKVSEGLLEFIEFG